MTHATTGASKAWQPPPEVRAYCVEWTDEEKQPRRQYYAAYMWVAVMELQVQLGRRGMMAYVSVVLDGGVPE